jgi:hypothetical protein
VQSQHHREPEQEPLRADAHFEVAPERKPAANRDELTDEPDSGFECGEDASTGKGIGRPGGPAKHIECRQGPAFTTSCRRTN